MIELLLLPHPHPPVAQRRREVDALVPAGDADQLRPLGQPEAASRVLLVGPWSPVSDEVFVQFDNQWYVAEHKRGTRSNELYLEVHHWYRGMGEWLVSTFPQRVGQFVGLTEKPKPIKALIMSEDYELGTYSRETQILRIDEMYDGVPIEQYTR